jgi:acyl transferase domain-containing protein
VPIEATPWPKDRLERVGVNSFGIGGANAHVRVPPKTLISSDCVSHMLENDSNFFLKVLLESAASIKLSQGEVTDSRKADAHLLVFSAKHSQALQKTIDVYRNEVLTNSHDLSDVSYTLTQRREFHNYRAFSLASSSAPNEMSPIHSALEPTKLIFTFTGQGAQWAQMGAQLIEKLKIFKTSIRALDTFLRSLSDPPDWSLEGVLPSQFFTFITR